MQVEATASIWSMVLGSGPVVQGVLISLILCSLLCWTIIFAKIRRFRQVNSANEEFEDIFWSTDSLPQIQTKARKMSAAPMAGVFLAGYEELKNLQDTAKNLGINLSHKIWIDSLERSLQKGIKEELTNLEFSLPILATIGNAGPFIGLFGTVWGIMRSFHDIGAQGSANLATVAPGISEALVATATGLAAAIPAVIAFNMFMSQLARLESKLQGFAGDFINLVERRLLPRTSRQAAQGQTGNE